MTTNYISIKSVLYDLSLTISDRYWNETYAMEWANKAARLLRSESTLISKVAYLPVQTHKSELPSDLKYLVQVVYRTNMCGHSVCNLAEILQLPEGSELIDKIDIETAFPWQPMRLTTNPFHSLICGNKHLMMCSTCAHEFSVAPDLTLTTTLLSGNLMVSYLGYPTDEEGCLLIPDNEEVKEAILHYVLYRYWMSKYTMKEDGAEGRMAHHLRMWNTLSTKASGNLNLPDVNQLENLKNQFNTLVPRENRFQQLFSTLSARENVNF